MELDDLARELLVGSHPSLERGFTALIRKLPHRGSVECAYLELKRQFIPGPREWAELARDVVALANSGGGLVVFGIADDCTRIGLSASLTSVLDPAKLIDQLRRKAPSASIRTEYVEVVYYRKRFGCLLVSSVVVPLVFDVEWGYNDSAGNHHLVIRPGLLYVRTPGRSGPAREIDVREVWQHSVDLATQKTLARIERVASLPPDAELIVSSGPKSDTGFVLVSGSEGRPVRIVDDPSAPAVSLRDVLSPEVPYSSVSGELMSQVRHWQQVDLLHRVSKHALLRWWLQRAELVLDDNSAAFCLLSAAYQHGYPSYWASSMSRPALLALLTNELAIGRAIPCQCYPYVVGTFFWRTRRKHSDPRSRTPQRCPIESCREGYKYPKL